MCVCAVITGRTFILRSDRLTLEMNSPTIVNQVSLRRDCGSAAGSRGNTRR